MIGGFVLIIRLLLVVALYGFLFIALYSLWRQLTSKDRSVGKIIPGISLRPLYGNSKNQQFLQHFEIIIGRAIGCDIQVDDQLVSAKHAKLKYHHKQWWLMDLSSTNGSFLNGERIDEPAVILSGDVIRFGDLEWKVSIES